jgi:DNA-binding transcriptional MerR regulator
MGERRSDAQSDSLRHGLDRVTIAEAAERLGLSQDAIRKRVRRGTLREDRDQDGLIHVYIPADEGVQDESKIEQDPVQDKQQDTQDIYVRSLEDQVRFLRAELERKDAILLRLAERVPELEPSSEPQGIPETVESASEGADRGEAWETRTESQGADDQERVPWWRKILGLGG